MFCTLRYTSGSRWAAQPQPHKGSFIPASSLQCYTGRFRHSFDYTLNDEIHIDLKAQLCWHSTVEKRLQHLDPERVHLCMCVSVCNYANARYSPVWLLSAWRECEWKSRSCCGWVLAYPSCWNPWTFVSPSDDYNSFLSHSDKHETMINPACCGFSHNTNDKRFI